MPSTWQLVYAHVVHTWLLPGSSDMHMLYILGCFQQANRITKIQRTLQVWFSSPLDVAA